jgi:hypothetical protein
MERDDVARVAALYELVVREGKPQPQLAPFLERTTFDHPWADPDIPSLVYEEDGEILAFLASNVRRMRFETRPVRMACSALLVAHPRARQRAAGAQLMRAYLTGPQDFTITDGATETVRRMWEGLGGHTVGLGCLAFVKVFRPMRLAGGLLAERSSRLLAAPVGAVAPALDGVAGLVARSRLVPHAPPENTEVVPLTPELVVDHLGAVTGDIRLHADYDADYLSWLFRELDEIGMWGPLWPGGVRRGPLWAELVRRGDAVEGWYVCQLRVGGFCRVLQFATALRAADAVFAQLAYRARARGAAGLYGRLEPRLVAPVTSAGAVLRPSDGRLLVHSRHAELARAVRAGEALLTRMDGEWW